MPQITTIEPQKRSDKRVNVFLDGKYGFAISIESVVKSQLTAGTIITEESIKDLLYQDYFEKLLDNLAAFVGRRPRSEREITQHAKEYFFKKYGKDTEEGVFINALNQVVEKLRQYNQVNDTEFAKWWIETRQRQNKSDRVITQELYQKGVAKEIIEKTLTGGGGGDELSKAKVLAEKKFPSYRALEPAKQKEKLGRYLASKGFDWEVIKEVLTITLS